MSLKTYIAKKIPTNFLDKVLLSFPFLYRTKFINFESYLDENGTKDLIEGIELVKDLPGNIIECGCARCGTSVILAKYLSTKKIMKKVYALDSFSGFDPKELENERLHGFTKDTSDSFTYSSLNYVKKKIRKLGLSDTLIPVNGYFQQTLHKIDSNFCMGLIDCDLGESLTYAAENIWPRLVTRGLLFFDDYGSKDYKGVKLAVDKFVNNHKNEIKRFGLSRRLYCIEKGAPI